uniref:Pectinesterase inhibitor domain-containing protein n=1 Tax=Ananas comosus var. bracteatus TaxID=296719 RepID=A0A6V7PR29_ANACO|nr:unnamed protein product [Ananas comosus var. bracteatus]
MQESATTAAAAALRYCDGALHRELCVAAVAAVPDAGNKTLPEVISAVLGRAAAAVRAAAANCSAYLRSDARRGGGLLGPRQRLALSDCLELFDHTIDELAAAAAALPPENSPATSATYRRCSPARSPTSTPASTASPTAAAAAAATRE